MVFTSALEPVKPDARYGDSLAAFFWNQLDVFANRELLVDYASGRRWTGAQMKQTAARVAAYLVEELRLEPTASCVFLHPNSDYLHLAALGVLFAGGSVCAGAAADPPAEHLHMLSSMAPRVVFAQAQLVAELEDVMRRKELELTGCKPLDFHVCVLDDDRAEASLFEAKAKVFGLHRDMLVEQRQTELPVKVGANDAAFVLFTSGSTGRPKPVARSQRNSLYVCHSLDSSGGRLWELNERSVLANQLELDHGTGTFSIKMCLAKGVRLIVLDGYKQSELVAAIEEHSITDCMLGSGLLHNLVSSLLVWSDEQLSRRLGSLRNLIAIGSPIASQPSCEQLMARLSELSIRQAYGMTECGFLTIVPRRLARASEGSVGQLLANLELELLDPESGRPVEELGRLGELYVRGPTVSPGYLGAAHAEQSAAAFEQLGGGFYRSRDLCQVKRASGDHQKQLELLFVRGRCNEVLCLHDGWKVLPSEIEQVLQEHPSVRECAVVGVPDPQLATCHAPRAYVVPAVRSQGLERELSEFVAARLSGPKRLTGGVRLLDELPRVGLNKVDRRRLRELA